MKYFGKPAGMWAVFGGSFRRELVRCFGLSEQSAYETARKAKKKYRELVFRNRNASTVRTMNNRNWFSPVSLS